MVQAGLQTLTTSALICYHRTKRIKQWAQFSSIGLNHQTNTKLTQPAVKCSPSSSNHQGLHQQHVMAGILTVRQIRALDLQKAAAQLTCTKRLTPPPSSSPSNQAKEAVSTTIDQTKTCLIRQSCAFSTQSITAWWMNLAESKNQHKQATSSAKWSMNSYILSNPPTHYLQMNSPGYRSVNKLRQI